MLSKFVASLALLATSAYAAQNQLQRVTGNIGPNPNNVGMYVYKPTNVKTPTALIVAIHYCTGSAQAFFTGTPYANLADTKGFIVVYPSSPRSGGCFDVASNATLTNNAGGDSQGIASMIKYSIANYGVDKDKVYLAGLSSGAMMSNVMAGAYPDLFKAASIYAGVPYACFAGPSDWNNQCAQGQLKRTGAAWGDLVRKAYPGYTGPYPKIQLWHGSSDTTLAYANFAEEIKQWTNVHNISETAASTEQNTPRGWTKSTYGTGQVVAYDGRGMSHSININGDVDMAWFGL